MRIHGVLLRTVEEQEKDDRESPIDPTKISFNERGGYAVTFNFDHSRAPVGVVRKVELTERGLEIEAELFEDPGPAHKLAIGITADHTEDNKGFLNMSLWMVAICKENSDKGMPDFEIMEEPDGQDQRQATGGTAAEIDDQGRNPD